MADIIEIPKRFRDILVSLINLSKESLAELGNLMQAGDGVGGSSKDAAKSFKSIPYEEAAGLIDAIIPIYNLKIRSNKSASEIVEDVIASIEEDDKDLIKNKSDRAKLSEIIFSLISNEETELKVKAISLLLEQSNIFTNAKIITDIRPVFDGEKIASPKAAVISHSLKMEYLENGEDRSFRIALDTRDCKNLIEILNRAIEKEQELKSYIENSGLKYIEVK